MSAELKIASLIATYEEFFVPSEERISYWFGDYGLHDIKYGIPNNKIDEIKNKALTFLGISEERFLENSEYDSRFNIVRDFVKRDPYLETKLHGYEEGFLDRIRQETDMDKTVKTNIGTMPISEYREIMALQYGFDSYSEMRKEGFRLGDGYDIDEESAALRTEKREFDLNAVPSELEMIRKGLKDVKLTDSKEALNHMTEQARNWRPSFQEYREMLDFRAKFHQYSMRNVSMIYIQNPNASYVGSFKHFKALGYSVNKGEHGMLITAPRKLAMAEIERGVWKSMKELTDEQRNSAKTGTLLVKEKTYFVPGYVYDISQTNCPQENLPKLLRGMSYKACSQEYYIALQNIAKNYGLSFSEENMQSVTLKGYYAPTEEKIAINKRLTLTDKAHTLSHELSHAMLHHATATDPIPMSQAEFEAESAAYISLKQAGFDMSDYSFRYIQHYLTDLSPEELQKALTRIDNCSSLLSAKIGEQLDLSQSETFEKTQEIDLMNPLGELDRS